MRSSTVDMLRAHLFAASIVALCLQVVTLLAALALGLSQHVFESTSFRLIAVAAIAGGVCIARCVAALAYRRALRARHASLRDSVSGEVWLSPACPFQQLVVLHLRLHRITYRLQAF